MKLSELADDVELVSESYGKCTVEDIKDEIVVHGRDASNDKWFMMIPCSWGTNAYHMLDAFIENESSSLYEGFYEKARDCITDDVVSKVQAILDEAFSNSNVTEYWEFGERVEIDVFPVKEGESA